MNCVCTGRVSAHTVNLSDFHRPYLYQLGQDVCVVAVRQQPVQVLDILCEFTTPEMDCDTDAVESPELLLLGGNLQQSKYGQRQQG